MWRGREETARDTNFYCSMHFLSVICIASMYFWDDSIKTETNDYADNSVTFYLLYDIVFVMIILTAHPSILIAINSMTNIDKDTSSNYVPALYFIPDICYDIALFVFYMINIRDSDNPVYELIPVPLATSAIFLVIIIRNFTYVLCKHYRPSVDMRINLEIQ